MMTMMTRSYSYCTRIDKARNVISRIARQARGQVSTSNTVSVVHSADDAPSHLIHVRPTCNKSGSRLAIFVKHGMYVHVRSTRSRLVQVWKIRISKLTTCDVCDLEGVLNDLLNTSKSLQSVLM